MGEEYKLHEATAKAWESHTQVIKKVQTAFQDADAGADMCTRIKTARKVGKGKKPSGKKGNAEAKAAFKVVRGKAKLAWKALRKAVKAEMTSAPKRRNQEVQVPGGGDVLVEGEDNRQPGCAEASVKCGGENKELCNAFSNFLHSMNCFNDAKEQMKDAAYMRY